MRITEASRIRRVERAIAKTEREIKKLVKRKEKDFLRDVNKISSYINSFRNDRDYSYNRIVEFCNDISEICECVIEVPDSVYLVQDANERDS